jgi:polysaccharide deacetylase 2 family uncharacterized protein YibQ
MQSHRFQRGRNAYLFALLFIILALLSAIALDYIDWKKGQESRLFSELAKKKEAPPFIKPLDQANRSQIASYGIPTDSTHYYEDEEGILHLMIDLPLKKYAELETLIEKELGKEKASVVKKEEQEGEEKNFYLWQVKGEKKQRLTILFSCTKEKPDKEVKPVQRLPKNKVAIIIDDLGYSLKAIDKICSIKQPLSVAVLPYSNLAKETAQIAHQNKLEVLLHLPLESINNKQGNTDTEGIIHSRMSEEEIIQTVDRNLDQVPFIQGVNNHMGSKITANEFLMEIILKRLRERNLFFIDSVTTGRSVAYRVAKGLGIPAAQRQVFLDSYDFHSTDHEDYIKGKMLELFRLAQNEGEAIGICHPTEETLRVLKQNFHLVKKFNVEPVFASQLVK